MFCPNCGTQNPETSQTCSKCGFNLKGAATPKFKGTMLMMGGPGGPPQPGAPPAPGANPFAPPPPAPPAPPQGSSQPPPAWPAPPPPQAPGGSSKLKGTMVGIAPPVPAPPGFGPDPMAPPPQNANLAGTLAVDPANAPMGAFAPPQPQQQWGGAPDFGAPPPQQPQQQWGGTPDFGAPPPPADPGYGAPQGYGPPQQALGGPAAGFAPQDYAQPMAPHGQGYAPPPDPNAQAGYGQMAPYGQDPNYAMAPAGPMGMQAPPGGGGAGAPGQIRNPMIATLAWFLCCFPYLGLFWCMKAEEELNRFLGKPGGGSILWLLFPLIPALAMPKLVAEARQRAGTQTQGEGSLIGYIFFPSYLLLKDVNEVWTAMGVQAK